MSGIEQRPGSRLEELQQGLDGVHERIEAACRAAQRPRADVTLVAVSKTWPATDVAALARLGVRDFGENRDREAADKARAVPEVRWHFVGALQTNKARSVATYAHAVHSVDRPDLVVALGEGARRVGRSVGALIQVSIDGDPRRGGVASTEVLGLAELVAGQPGLRLEGVMTVPPLGMEPDRAFEILAEAAAMVRAAHPAASWVSAGMSRDLEAAVAAGGTHVRVGTALFGHRGPPLR